MEDLENMKKIFICNLAIVKSRHNETCRGGPISNSFLLQDIVNNDNSVIVITTGSQNIVFKENGYIIIQKKILFKNRILRYLYRNFIMMIILIKIIKRNKIYAIISTTASTVTSYIAALIYNKKHFIIVRAYEHLNYNSDYKFYNLKYHIYKKIYQSASAIITNSKFMQYQINKCIGGANIKVIYPPILKSKNKIILKKIKKIVSIGTSNNKGIDIVYKIAKKFKKIDFYIYGIKNKILENKFKIFNNVFLMGYETDQEKIYLDKDLVLVPSLWAEPFGRVSIEAQSFGKPVLVSDIGGLTETVNNNEDFLVKNNTTNEWIEKINNLTNNINKEYSINYIYSFDLKSHSIEVGKLIEGKL